MPGLSNLFVLGRCMGHKTLWNYIVPPFLESQNICLSTFRVLFWFSLALVPEVIVVPSGEKQEDMNLSYLICTRNLVNKNSCFVRSLSFRVICHKGLITSILSQLETLTNFCLVLIIPLFSFLITLS